MKCRNCTSTSFRRSKMREQDMLHLALLEYPVRCTRCSHRQYVPFVMAALSLSSRARHPRLPPANESWEVWTSGTYPKATGIDSSPPGNPGMSSEEKMPEDSRNVW